MKSSNAPPKTSIQIVLQTAFLGDLLLAVPLLIWAKKLQPEIPLYLICRKGLGSTLQRLGIVDGFWEIEKGKADTYRKILKEIKKFHVKRLVSAHTSVRTTLFCAQIKAEEKITFAKPWNFFLFDQRISWPADLPESLRLLSLLKNSDQTLKEEFLKLPSSDHWFAKDAGSGKLPPPPSWADPGMLSIQPDRSLLEKFNLQDKKWIALFPGSVWATKMWRADGFAELGQALQKQGYQIVVMGGPEEKTLGQKIADQIPESLNLCGVTSLFDSLMLVGSAHLVVGNDSSSSHMAALMKTPVVSVFGPTVLKFGYRPWAARSAVVEREGMVCRPCGPHGHRQCPLRHHDCMQRLETREVLRAVQGMLT